MKIQQIGNSNGVNYLRTKKDVFSNSSMTFKGYVNGNYYKDSVIKVAKEALRNPDWKREFLEQKELNKKNIYKWHEGLFDDNKTANRILGAVFSLGLSELFFTGIFTANCVVDNALIEKKINEVERCMDDLKAEGY